MCVSRALSAAGSDWLHGGGEHESGAVEGARAFILFLFG